MTHTQIIGNLFVKQALQNTVLIRLVYYELFPDDFVLDQMTLGQIHDTLQGDKQSLCEARTFIVSP